MVVRLIFWTNGAGGTVDVKLQHSDDGAAWSDVGSGAFTQVTESNDNAVYEKVYVPDQALSPCSGNGSHGGL